MDDRILEQTYQENLEERLIAHIAERDINYVEENADAYGAALADSRIKELSEDVKKVNPDFKAAEAETTGGCYVATCVYGAYDCPEVWTLRRYRDDILARHWYGRAFIRAYYAASPTIVKWFGDTDWFKRLWRGRLDGMVDSLRGKGVESTPYDDRKW